MSPPPGCVVYGVRVLFTGRDPIVYRSPLSSVITACPNVILPHTTWGSNHLGVNGSHGHIIPYLHYTLNYPISPLYPQLSIISTTPSTIPYLHYTPNYIPYPHYTLNYPISPLLPQLSYISTTPSTIPYLHYTLNYRISSLHPQLSHIFTTPSTILYLHYTLNYPISPLHPQLSHCVFLVR